MSISRQVFVTAIAAGLVVAMQLTLVSDCNAQNRLGKGAPGGILSPSSMQASGGDEGAKAKFVEYLDEKNLDLFRGYKSEEVPESWKIEGKYLVCEGGGGDIMTKETFSDFELQVEWNVEEGGNSGIMFRVNNEAEKPYMSGPEIQILDDENHADGKSDLTSAGSLYGLYAADAESKSLRPLGSWNKTRLRVLGNQLTHYLNNKKVLDIEIGSDEWNEKVANSKFKDWEMFAKAESGHIVFQDHGDPVKFRNIRIKKLGVMEDEGVSDRPGGPGAIGGPAGVGGDSGRSNRPRPGDDAIGSPPAGSQPDRTDRPQRGGGGR